MLIEKVELRNIKSFGDPGCEVNFLPGVNLIWGDNGSGKTTILEAIGYCLFGAVEYNVGQFLREGSSGGQVVLTFQNQDDRRYEVIREINSSTGNLKIRDLQTGRMLHNKRSDAEAWLSEQLGAEFGGYGKDLFKNAIGVPQGKMTASFGGTGRTRKPIFDPILRVDEYDDADARLAKARTRLTKILTDQREIRAGLETDVNRIAGLEADRDGCAERIADNRDSLKRIEARLAQLETELAALEGQKKRLDDLVNQLSTARLELGHLDEQQQKAQSEVVEAEQAAGVLKATEAGYQAHRAADDARRMLEEKRIERDGLLGHKHGIEKRLGEIEALLAGIEKDLQAVAAAEKRVSELEPQVTRQGELEARVRELEAQVAERRRQLDQAGDLRTKATLDQKRLAELVEKLERRFTVERLLTEKQAQRDGASATINQLDGHITGVRVEGGRIVQEIQTLLLGNQRRTDAEARRTALISEIETMQATLARMEAEVREKSALLVEQEALEAEKTREQERSAGAQADSDSCKRKLDELQERLAMLEAAETAECPVCRAPLSEDHRRQVLVDFESERQAMTEQQQAARLAKKQAEAEAKRIQAHLGDIQKRLGTLASESQAVGQRQQIEARAGEIMVQEGILAETAYVPQRLSTQKKAQGDLDEQLMAFNTERSAAEALRTGLDRELGELNRDLAQLPQPAQAGELKDGIAKALADAGQLEAQAAALDGAEQERAKRKQELDELGDPRTEQAQQRGKASGRATLEDRREKLTTERIEQSQARTEAESSLQAYATLDQDLEQASRDLAQTEADHRRYLENMATAGKLEQRRKALEDTGEAFQDQNLKCKSLETEVEQARQAYDPVCHASVKAENEQAVRERVRINTQLEEWNSSLTKAIADLEELYQKRDRFEAVCQEVERLGLLTSVFDFVRRSIKQAGPEIVRQRVKAVSASADRIFQEILGDMSLALEWDETYAIQVRCGGEKRDFEQLSGGEQMAAAIAVRLALMLHMADNNLRWLFLDEPTANMDNLRRDKLADRITRLEQLQQIFVITHDDAFQRDTHHLIQVTKEDGVSQVQVGR